MLVSQNYINKSKSHYVCDRCGEDMNSINRNAIYVAEGLYTMKKRWDLCPKCFNALKRGINKH